MDGGKIKYLNEFPNCSLGPLKNMHNILKIFKIILSSLLGKVKKKIDRHLWIFKTERI